MKICVIYKNINKKSLAKDFFYKTVNMLIKSEDRVLKNIKIEEDVFSVYFSNGDHLIVQTEEKRRESVIKYHSVIILE